MKDVVLNEVMKELKEMDKEVLKSMINICTYYKKNIENIKEYFNYE